MEEDAHATLLSLLSDDVYLNRVSHSKAFPQLLQLLRDTFKQDPSLLTSLHITNTGRPPYSLLLVVKITAAILQSLPPTAPPQQYHSLIDAQLFALERLYQVQARAKFLRKARALAVSSAQRHLSAFASRLPLLRLPTAYAVVVEASAEDSATREDTLQAFFLKALPSAPLPTSSLPALTAVLRQVTEEEYAAYVEPRLGEWVKGEAQSALAVVSAVVEALKVSFGENTSRCFTAVVSQLLYAEDAGAEETGGSLRISARQALSQLVAKASGVQVVVEVLEELRKVLKGKGVHGKQVRSHHSMLRIF